MAQGDTTKLQRRLQMDTGLLADLSVQQDALRMDKSLCGGIAHPCEQSCCVLGAERCAVKPLASARSRHGRRRDVHLVKMGEQTAPQPNVTGNAMQSGPKVLRGRARVEILPEAPELNRFEQLE